MNLSNSQRADAHSPRWQSVCSEHDLVCNSGVVVWLDGAQVALFYLLQAEGKTLYAIDNHDPQSGANVIGRGLVGSLKVNWWWRRPCTSSTFDSKTGAAWSIRSSVCASGPCALTMGKCKWAWPTSTDLYGPMAVVGWQTQKRPLRGYSTARRICSVSSSAWAVLPRCRLCRSDRARSLAGPLCTT